MLLYIAIKLTVKSIKTKLMATFVQLVDIANYDELCKVCVRLNIYILGVR